MSARPEYAIALAVIGVLVAIGVPALQRGDVLIGVPCMAAAACVALYKLVEWIRLRNNGGGGN